MLGDVDSIRVVVRVRPFSNYELEHENDCVVTCAANTVTVRAGHESKCFKYDATYWSVDGRTARYASQEVIYEDIGASMFANAFDGYNACVFAYGQTGSGKSYTMLGFGPESSDLGIIPRTVEAIFAVKSSMEMPGPDQGELRVWASSAEIYNERIRDLLQPGAQSNELNIFDHPELGVSIPGLVSAACLTAADIRKLWAFSNRRRATAATNMNAISSRSHAVFMIHLQRLEGQPPRRGLEDERNVISSQLQFIDLAGSERLSRGSKCTKIEDASAINISLSALANVIKALIERDALVPFRSSKITSLMKEALCGNSKTSLVATISPASDSLHETLHVLQFAESVKLLKTKPLKKFTMRTDQIVQALQSEVRLLKAKRSNAIVNAVDECGSALADEYYRDEIAQRDSLLAHMTTSYERQLEEAVIADCTRDEALKKLGLTSSLIDEVLGIESYTPYMLNMSSDPMLVGCLIYFLHPGVETRIGAHAQNEIVLTGLGMPEFLCCITNLDQQTITISTNIAPSAVDAEGNGTPNVKANVRTNGSFLLAGETRKLQHWDYLIFGRAHAMRLTVPAEQKRLAGGDIAAMKAAQGLYEPSMFKLFIPEESEAWNELRLYFEDLWQRLGEERGRVFFSCLIEASYLVDEANEITAEMRPDDCLKFEVELVWDIHREASDIIVIRAMQFPTGKGDASVLCYWSLESFKDRVVMMRDCFDVYYRVGDWAGRDDPLEDPWMDSSIVELRLRMQMVEDATSKAHEETAVQMDVEESALGVGPLAKNLAIASGLSGPSKLMTKRRSTSPVKSGQSSQRNSSTRVGIERLNGDRAGQANKSSKLVATPPAIPWRGGGYRITRNKEEGRRAPPAMERVSARSPEERRAPPAMEKVTFARPVASPESQQREEARLQTAHTPPPVPSLVLQQPVLPEPDAEPSTKDAIIAALRQQLANKENEENKYKDKINSLRQNLSLLERQHGSLMLLASEQERQFTSAVSSNTSGGSHVLASAATLAGSASAGMGTLVRSHTTSTVPAVVLSPPPPQGGRILLSGRLDTVSLVSTTSAGQDANTAISAVGPSPQRMSSSRSSVAQTIETPLTTGSRSLIVPNRQASSSTNSFIAARSATGGTMIAIAVSAMPTSPVLQA
mmetsp:Transcript_93745/g.146340  ORF Transcript_93745/g.146340 Transcript_93745/m.146340 type:complete len:1137 (-) Transcript_93745:195-3605(-)